MAEADRKDLMDDKLPRRKGIEVEFADCIIRIFDTAAAKGLDVPEAFIGNNGFNQTRADHKFSFFPIPQRSGQRDVSGRAL